MINNTNISPVLIPVYDRYSHFNKAINSLSKCKYSSKTILYVYIDFPNSKKSANNQNLILDTIKSYDSSFKNIIVLRRPYNFGAKNNILDAIDDLFQNHDSIIYLEDDCLVHPSFLSYMNLCLNNYANDDTISGISGYLYPIDISHSFGKNDIIRMQFSCAWGMGLWKSKYTKPVMDWTQLLSLIKQKSFVQSLNQISNRHHYAILKEVLFKNSRWGDFCFMLNSIIENKYWIFPVETLVKNIGADGSGVHQGNHNERILLNQQFPKNLNINFNLLEDSKLNYLFQKKTRLFYSMSLKARFIYLLLKTHFYITYGKLK